MPKSFSIDLNGYSLVRTVGDSKKVLKTPMDRSDLINCLESLGYNKLSEHSFNNKRFGNIIGLEDTVRKFTLGIPTSANVEIARVDPKTNVYLITFTY